MKQKTYAFLLDFFPLVDGVSHENAVLAAVLQATALDMLEETGNERLNVLLSLSRDLGYIEGDVAAFLQRELSKQ